MRRPSRRQLIETIDRKDAVLRRAHERAEETQARLDRFHTDLQAEVDKHKPDTHATLGDTTFPSNDLWCTVCRTPWPCYFMAWAHKMVGGTSVNKNWLAIGISHRGKNPPFRDLFGEQPPTKAPE